jgi:hypothetical protein
MQEAEEMKKSNIIRDKYPRGLLTASKMPAKGLYCLGFFRALNPHLQAELAVYASPPPSLLFCHCHTHKHASLFLILACSFATVTLTSTPPSS